MWMYENRVRPTGHGFAIKDLFFLRRVFSFLRIPTNSILKSSLPVPGSLVFFPFLLILCGCGSIVQNGSSALVGTPGTVSFGSVTVGQSATANLALQNRGIVPVQLSSLNLSSPSFSVTGQSSLPATIAVGATYNVAIKFNPTASGQASGLLSVGVSQSSKVSASTVSLSGTGAPGLSALTCSHASVSGSASDSCSVTLNASALTGGFTVNLASSDAAVTLPASVTVASNATSATFSANVTPVSTAQAATLTASSGAGAATFALQLAPNSPALTINSSSISFGTTAVKTPVTQGLVLTASGASPVTVTSAALSGAGFSVVGGTLPITLNPGQSSTINVQFDPTATGAATGQLVIGSSALANGSAMVALSGTGVAYEVQLNWSAPSTGTVTGYNVYRAEGGSSTYDLLNTSVDQQTSYKDPTVQSGGVYDYVVKSVDSAGAQSGASNTTTVTVP
jgi:Abnormal spindle-like microcephaly-assoc'd, ASPM-SPD-2-Hydin